MQSNLPLVSIGLPVFNGEKHLSSAIESLLNQSYTSIEMIISDNCSTDSTSEICEDYVEKDSRLKYYRNDMNIGAAKNFNKLVSLAKGTYFMWAAHDDVWNRMYVEKCVEKLENEPQSIMCVTDMNFINEDGIEIEYQYQTLDTSHLTPSGSVKEIMKRCNWYDIYGLIRRDEMLKTNLYQEIYGGDVVFVMELLLLGRISKVYERLFSYRVSSIPKNVQTHVNSISPISTVRENLINMPYTNLAMNMYKCIMDSKLIKSEKNQAKEIFLETLLSNNYSFLINILNENNLKLDDVFSRKFNKDALKRLLVSI